MSAVTAPIYHDLQGLAALQAQASNTPETALEEVAVQFEALFVQMMLKSMRDATASVAEGGLFASDQMEVYQSMFDQQLALDLSRRGVLGLTELLVEQLAQPGPEQVSEEGDEVFTLPTRSAVHSTAELPAAVAVSSAAAPADRAAVVADRSVSAAAVDSRSSWLPESPEQFIREVWDYAVAAARRLDLDPRVLVAQSALETGWGKKVIRAADGSSSFNLFGIKAGTDWLGKSAAVSALEFRDGVAAMEQAVFRVYDSIASSFDDYVDFLERSPRYQQALARTADSGEFLQELQGAGYATDPRYAQKIMGIMTSSSYAPIIDELRNLQPLPMVH